MPIPFNDLKALHHSHREAFHHSLDALLDQSDFIGGKVIQDFEAAFARACEVEAAVAVANGTEALFVALKVFKIGPGDLVVTVPNSFMATAEAISLCGAEPLFVDVNENDFCMDVDQLKTALSHHPQRQRIKAVVPVHLLGRSAPMREISALCKTHGLPLIADAAQAHLAQCEGRGIATWADLTTFSFYPGKNLGALGDAGAVVGNDVELCAKVRRFANHGRSQKYLHESIGTNARCDTLQAYFLLEKLPSLAAQTQARQRLAKLYAQKLSGIPGCTVLRDEPERPSVFHLLVIRHKHRDALQAHLKKMGIESGVHYPVPLHLQPAYGDLGHQPGDFPVCERLALEQLSLPLFPSMEESQVLEVCAAIGSFFPA
jgi:dTDP-4-amino-4,6-dideoxygalactose transaminase